MYRILYNDSTIFDPYGNDNEVVSDASMSVKINAAAYMDFTMPRLHPLYNTIAERDGVVTLYWDKDILFQGVIESIDMDINGNKAVSCVSALDYLNDTVVRPYSTIAGEQELTAPSSIDGYFQWLIDQHNKHVLDSRKRFDIGVNQGANLKNRNFFYRSSTNNPTTASEISSQLLDALGGYLLMRYLDGRYVLDLYSSLNTVNSQIIDFGVNITDFSKTVDTKDQYTALILKGGFPEFDGGSFESGDWTHWIAHPNEPLVNDKAHGGHLSSFFVSGTGEYINDSSFYFRHGRRYRATVYVKNERGSNVTIHGSYQYEQSGIWTTVNVGASLAVKNEGDNWTEFTFDFVPNISEYSKIRPRWYFDDVSNDSNRRVYLDDFSFSQVNGDTTVAEDPISISMVPDGVTQYDQNILKSGDVIYDSSAVLRYGYKEEVYNDSTITDIDDLIKAGIKALTKRKNPQISLDIKAVDLSMFMKEYTHLNVGDIVRVRSAVHNTDEYLMVNSITLDLEDPGRSRYSIGKVYDSLTGQQSGLIKSLNSAINSSFDYVVSLSQTAKDHAVQISSSQQAAESAQSTADSAHQMSTANSEEIAAVKSTQTEYGNQLNQVQHDVTGTNDKIEKINERIDHTNSEIESTKSDVNSLRSSTETELQNVKQSVSKAQFDIKTVANNVSNLSSDLEGTKSKVDQVTADLGNVKADVSNAITKADQASKTANEVKTTAESALAQSNTALQTANSVKTELETNYSTSDEIAEHYTTKSDVANTYLTKSDAANTYATKNEVANTYLTKSNASNTYATKSMVEQTSQSITSSVEATYATKATVESLENIANNAIQTWMSSGVPTLSNKPASDWTTSELKSQHSGDIYYDTDTGYSYRFGSSDGSTYSWALIKDTDISKALADAAKAQKTADSATSGVSELKASIPVTYATKTELTQKADSITSRVEEVAQAGTATSSKVTQLEQKTDEIKSTVSEQGSKLNNAVTTISQVSQKADSISSTVQQVQGDLNSIDVGGTNLAKLGRYGFHPWVINTSYDKNEDLYAFTIPANLPASEWGYGLYVKDPSYNYGGVPWGKCGILSFYIYADHACPINIDVNCFPMTASAGSGNDHDNTSKRAYSSYEIPSNQWVQVWCRWENSNGAESTGNPTKDDLWDDSSIYIIASSNTVNVQIKKVKFEVGTKPTAWSPCPADVDTNIAAAQGTANSALSKASSLEQSLDGFKTNVSQTYETKTDALNKQSTINQKVDGLRSEVSQTYATKTSLDATNGKVTQAQATGDQAIFAALPSMADTTQPDRWLCAIFPTGNGSVQSLPSYSLIASLAASETEYRTDNGGVINSFGMDYHYGLIRTLVSFAADKTWTFTYNHDDGSRIYVDGVVVFESAPYNTHNDPVTITFTKGNHIVDIMWSNSSGGYGVWGFSVPLSSIATTMYAPAGASALASKIGNILNNPTSDNLWPNQWFDDDKPLLGSPGTEKPPSGGKSRLLASRDHFNPSVMAPVCPGHRYRITADAKRTAGSIALRAGIWYTKETLGVPYDSYTYSTSSSSLGNDWNRYTWEVTIPSGKQAGSLFFQIEQNYSGGSTKWLVGNAVLQDITAAYDAQSTADTANSNAANAQNRVGNLETCIKMTADGVRVGKIDNGNFSGYSALVNSAGSFDIVDAGGNTCSSFNQNTIKLGENNNDSVVDMGNGTVKFYGSSGSNALNIDTREQGPITINGYDLGLIGRSCLLKQTSNKTTAQAGKWVNVPMTPAYINTKGQCATRTEPFTQEGDGVRINVKGLYLISIAGIPVDVLSTDIVRLSLNSNDGDSYIQCQYAAVESGNMMSHTEMRILDAKTYHLCYKCDQGGGSNVTDGFVTITFMGYLQ